MTFPDWRKVGIRTDLDLIENEMHTVVVVIVDFK